MTKLTIDYFNEYWNHLNTMDNKQKNKVMNLGMGMPDLGEFKTPKILLEELHKAIDGGDYSLYSPPEGNIELLNEIVSNENKSIGENSYSVDNVLLTSGAISAYSLIVDSLIKNDDEILVLNPSYFSLAGLSELRAKIKTVNCPKFEIKADLVKQYKSEKTKLVFLCNPNNPTGYFISPKELESIIEMAKSYGIFIAIDESCKNYVFEPEKNKLPANITEKNVIRIKGFSKEQNFSGYRQGYILTDEKISKDLKYKIPVLYGNPPVMANRALLTEFKIKNGKIENQEYQDTLKENFKKMKENRELVYNKLSTSNAIEKIILPEACYYMFVKCKYSKGSSKLFEELLYKESVNVCPGVLFGMPENEAWIRICFARKKEFLEESLNRILNFLENEIY